MWIRTKDKLVNAIALVVARNYFSKQKYVIKVVTAAGGLSAEPHLVAFFKTKEEANAELERIFAAIEAKETTYSIGEAYYSVN